MFVNCSPAESNVPETLNSLEFAKRRVIHVIGELFQVTRVDMQVAFGLCRGTELHDGLCAGVARQSLDKQRKMMTAEIFREIWRTLATRRCMEQCMAVQK